jgi:hypothetical protein
MPNTPPVSTPEVLAAEYEALRPGGNFKAKDEKDLFREVHGQARPLSALCISGGGIRSATFSLGMIQGLAEHGLLGQFDYLSTVSGGGYIGGWLTAWIQRVKGVGNVIPHLCTSEKPRPVLPEGDPMDHPDPVQHLREYNNYLTPKLGALSTDTWTLGATVSRNILLNWLVLIPLMMFVLVIPRLLLSIDAYGDLFDNYPDVIFSPYGSAAEFRDSAAIALVLPGMAALLFMCCMINTLRYLPAVGGKDHTAADFVRYVLGPLVLSVLAFSAYDSLHFQGSDGAPAGVGTAHGIVAVMLWTLVPSLMAWLGYLASCGKPLRERIDLLAGPLSIAIVLLGLGTGAAAWLLTNQLLLPTSWAQYVTVGPPLLLAGFLMSGAIFVGLSSGALQDEDREWLSRGTAYVMLFCTAWVAVCAVVLLLPGWAFAWGREAKAALVAAGGITGWFSSFAGFKGDQKKPGAAPSVPHAAVGVLLKIAPALFIMLLATGLAVVTNALLATTGKIPKEWWNHDYLLERTTIQENALWALGFLALSWLMARYININKFSLHGMYRDRLIRAYLGASNPRRKANRFIGFCESDNIKMHEIDPGLRPFHVVNLTLNLVGGDRLAWQQRKAESMTASPLHCGNSRLGYRESGDYGGKDGISLGTAITISGAAASPSMGYHSSPVVGFILTLFNLRLGAWLGNPGIAGNKTWTHAGPKSAVKSLVREAVGLTNDESEYVYLSDGGHFENLGLYEMVARRCRTIVAIDSGCDEKFAYEDLGNALRKIRIDLKIPIVFRNEAATALRAGRKIKRCATATIQYSAVDGDGTDGELIYIKPMLLGNEPPDVTSYHSAHPSFPHQSTAEQWFDESQTESYRMLGQYSATEIFCGWKPEDDISKLCSHIEKAYLAENPR